MKHYELLYLISGNVQEEKQEALQHAVADLIKKAGGSLTRQEVWGRKKLAYPVKKERHGTYLLLEFDINGAELAALDKKLRLNDQILRHLLVEKPVLSAAELLKQEAARQRRMAYAERKKAREREEAQKEALQKQPAEKEGSKIKLEELDKKLDELLDHDILT